MVSILCKIRFFIVIVKQYTKKKRKTLHNTKNNVDSCEVCNSGVDTGGEGDC